MAGAQIRWTVGLPASSDEVGGATALCRHAVCEPLRGHVPLDLVRADDEPGSPTAEPEAQEGGISAAAEEMGGDDGPAAKRHLIILVNGLFGSADNW